ncbi:MAG: Ig-like domain-containing protein [Bacteroidota bacterium]|jgi:WD40 repeat protein
MKVYFSFVITSVVLIYSGCQIEDVEIPKEPKVVISKPISGSRIFDSTEIVIEASDDVGIEHIELYIDGILAQNGKLYYEPYTYAWNTRMFDDSTVHEIYARAFDVDSNISVSSKVKVTAYRLAPSDFSVTMSADTVVELRWTDKSTSETAYQVLGRSNDSGFSLIETLPANSTEYRVRGNFLSSNTYSYKVRAMLDNQKSIETEPRYVSPVLNPPQSPKFAVITDDSVTVSWENSIFNFEKGFEIELSEMGGPFTLWRTSPPGSKSATLYKSYLSGTTYAFRVRWFSENNVSPYSSVISTSIPFDAPKELTMVPVIPNGVTLHWKDGSVFEDGVAIERKSSLESGFSEISRVGKNSTSWSDGTLDSNLSYQYRVFAYTGHNKSKYSNTISIGYISDFGDYRSFQAHQGSVTSVKFNKRSDDLYSAGSDANVNFWNTSGDLQGTIHSPSNGIVDLATSDDGIYCVTADDDNVVRLYNAANRTLLKSFLGNTDLLTCVDINSEQQLVVSGGRDSVIRLWNFSNPASPSKLFSYHHSAINSVALNPAGDFLASTDNGHVLHVADVQSGSIVWSEIDSSVTQGNVDYNSDGTVVALGKIGNGTSMRLFLSGSGTPFSDFGFNYNCTDLEFSPDNTYIVVGSVDGFIYVTNQDGSRLIRKLPAEQTGLTSVTISRDNIFIAAGFQNGKIQIWKYQKYWHVQ